MKNRHGRPRKDYLDSLKRPTKGDYGKLVRACLEALINGETDVLIGFSYVLKFPADFPRGILEKRMDTVNVHRIKARKLLDWLRDKGYTSITASDLREQKIAFTKLERSFNEIDKIWVDECQELFDNVEHQQSGEDDV